MNRLFLIFFSSFLLWLSPIQAQQLSLRPLSFLGVATNTEGGYFYDGGGFELQYQHKVWKGRVVGGLEYRMINWGNQVALNIGYNLPFWKNDHWRASATLSTQVGWALFYQKPLAVFGVELVPEIEWQSKKRFFLTFAFGIRFSNSPAYVQYGAINTVLDIPIKVGLGFRIGKK